MIRGRTDRLPTDPSDRAQPEHRDVSVLDREHLADLLDALRERGYTVLGPTVRQQAITYEEVTSPADLPLGWTDEQEAGGYRLRRRDDEAVFGYAVGPHSWKRYLSPPRTLLWRGERTDGGFSVHAPPPDEHRYALLGVRACELAAMAITDRVFQGEHTEPTYAARRSRLFLVAVNCGAPAGTCFCSSMGTGPTVTSGFDLALTELLPDRPDVPTAAGHRFLVEVGSSLGADVLAAVPTRPAEPADHTAAQAVTATAAAQVRHSLDTDGLPELLRANYDSDHWDDVAARCLTCGNCTSVCPTCFCTTVMDVTSLTGVRTERWRTWDSCFTADFSYLHGGSVRASGRSRYRQWITHKLSTWTDQFGTSGCVGCGRCITWCPVGIDITEEVRTLRDTVEAATDQGEA